MKKILAIMLKENFPFYISLVFFIFPFIYTITGTYPFYILYFTIIAKTPKAPTTNKTAISFNKITSNFFII